jgi:hypothetical protein
MPSFATPDNVARPGGWLGGGQQPISGGFAVFDGQQQQPQQQPNLASIFGSLMQRQQQSPTPFSQMPPNATTATPQGYDSYGFDKNVVDYLNRQRQDSAHDAGVNYQYDPQTQTFTGATMGGQVRKSLADIQREAGGQQQYDPTAAASDMQYRPQVAQQPQPFNPFQQPQQPSYMQDPEFQGYQTQAQDLSRQMDEYMRKAPMYQQLQDLQGKMAPFQQREDMQRMQQMQQRQMQLPGVQQQPASFDQRAIAADPQGFQQYMQAMQQREQQRPGSTMLSQQQPQFNPYQQQRQQFNPYQRQNPYQQQRQQFNPYQQQMQQRQQYQPPMGLQSLMGRLGGRGMPQAQPRMLMDMPETFGREQRYAMPTRDYSRIGSAGGAAPAPEMVAAPAVMPVDNYWANSW